MGDSCKYVRKVIFTIRSREPDSDSANAFYLALKDLMPKYLKGDFSISFSDCRASRSGSDVFDSSDQKEV